MKGHREPWEPVTQPRPPESRAHGSEDIQCLLLFGATGIIRGKILFLALLSYFALG